ncbi:MAG: peptide chain release factor N(5)-glutamine methyltransferase [Sarcina sp.]
MGKIQIGGQGLLNGVAINGKKGKAVATREEDNTIKLNFEKIYRVQEETGLRAFPFFRGILIIFDTVSSGVESLDIISDLVSNDMLNLGKMKNKKLINFLAMILALILFLFIFLAVPVFFINILRKIFSLSDVLLSVLEGSITIVGLILYMYVIGFNEDIDKMFRYHGAEHKVIACYENNLKLTKENVKKSKRFHLRCGSNLIFMIIINSSLVYLFLGWDSSLIRIIMKILLVPIIAGISYELVKFVANSNSFLAKVIAFPGLKLQLLTTREPKNEEIEVALLALKKAEGIRIERTIREILNETNQIFKNVGIDSYILDAQLLMCYVLGKDKLWLITNVFDRVSIEDEERYLELVKKRKNKYPMAYILGRAEFMNIDFIVKEGVLIPRGDTEILVEEVLKHIDKYEKLDICDLCCGSGAIGLTIAEYRTETEVDLLDIEEKPEEVTNINIKNFELENRARFIHSDLFSGIENKKYDIIVSNPPYIKEEVIETLMDDVKNYEPHIALSGGESGLIFYEKIINEAVDHLKGKMILAFEIGHDQGTQVQSLMEKNNFENVKIIKDLAGLDRVVIGNLIEI